jgi:hypothetical protein
VPSVITQAAPKLVMTVQRMAGEALSPYRVVQVAP